MQLQKSLLGHILGFGRIAHHAHTQRIDAFFVQRVELGEGAVVSGLGLGKEIGFGESLQRR